MVDDKNMPKETQVSAPRLSLLVTLIIYAATVYFVSQFAARSATKLFVYDLIVNFSILHVVISLAFYAFAPVICKRLYKYWSIAFLGYIYYDESAEKLLQIASYPYFAFVLLCIYVLSRDGMITLRSVPLLVLLIGLALFFLATLGAIFCVKRRKKRELKTLDKEQMVQQALTTDDPIAFKKVFLWKEGEDYKSRYRELLFSTIFREISWLIGIILVLMIFARIQIFSRANSSYEMTGALTILSSIVTGVTVMLVLPYFGLCSATLMTAVLKEKDRAGSAAKEFFKKRYGVTSFLIIFFAMSIYTYGFMGKAILISAGQILIFSVAVSLILHLKRTYFPTGQGRGWNRGLFKKATQAVEQDNAPKQAVGYTRENLEKNLGREQIAAGRFLADVYFKDGQIDASNKLANRLIVLNSIDTELIRAEYWERNQSLTQSEAGKLP